MNRIEQHLRIRRTPFDDDVDSLHIKRIRVNDP